jgi:H+/Cl- antiporter ClcA
MAGALAAFFGSPLGGSLFALEVCSRFGVEYYEHTLEAILCGEITLTVFRTLSQIPPSAIWTITSSDNKLTAAYPIYILYGAMIGAMGAMISSIFGYLHKSCVMSNMAKYQLMDRNNTVRRALVGASVFIVVGVLVPQTLFWSEEEFQNIATMDTIDHFPHLWPAISITGLEMHNFVTALTVGVAKLVTISSSIAGGFRGGVIFPLFASGAAFGRALHEVCPFIPVQVCVICFAAAIQVPITRTALSTSIILTYLSGEPQALAAILAASLVSLFCTVNTPVLIMTQVPRLDLEGSIHHHSTLSSPIIVSTKSTNINTNPIGNSPTTQEFSEDDNV